MRCRLMLIALGLWLAACGEQGAPGVAGADPGRAVGQSTRPQVGGESHFATCDIISVDSETVDCAGVHACKTPVDHAFACCACDGERFCALPGLDECPDGPWDERCHAVAVEGEDAPFDCRELDRCDPTGMNRRIACGACDPRYDQPRPDPCPTR